jgi:hypothetical protein
MPSLVAPDITASPIEAATRGRRMLLRLRQVRQRRVA